MYDYGTFSFDSKAQVLERAKEYWNPDKTQFWTDSGVDLVIDRRQDYFLWDMSGRRLIDMHLNGGTYNLGHRNPELVHAITEGMQHFDVGNHHFASLARAELAERLAELTPGSLQYTVFASGGSEAIDIAIKTARRATGRRRIVTLAAGYHGRTGLSGAAGQDTGAAYFLSDLPEQFAKVPFGDVDAVAQHFEDSGETVFRLGDIVAAEGPPETRFRGRLELPA